MADGSNSTNVITTEIDVLTMKLNAVAMILMEVDGLEAAKRCGRDVEQGLFYLLTDMIIDLRRQVAPLSEFYSGKKKGGAS